jgi:dipeptidyl aminopeptidase/acylaminoacyl peptidase
VELSLKLAAALRSADVQVHLIKDGDHRLSRPADIAILLDTLSALGRAWRKPLKEARCWSCRS